MLELSIALLGDAINCHVRKMQGKDGDIAVQSTFGSLDS